MTHFQHGDPIKLPQELGGWVATYRVPVSTQNYHKIVINIQGLDVSILLPEKLLQKAEPTATGSVYESQKTGYTYVRLADERTYSVKKWLRINGSWHADAALMASWEEIA